MRVSPRLHNIEFGEGLRWATPAGTATFFLWSKRIPDESAPRWSQTAGFNVALNAAIRFGGEVTPFVHRARRRRDYGRLARRDVDLRRTRSGGPDGDGAGCRREGHRDRPLPPADPEQHGREHHRGTGKAAPSDPPHTREKVAAAGGKVRVDSGDGIGHELMELAALDRRVAEVRARIVWFDTAAGGNALPRAEHW